MSNQIEKNTEGYGLLLVIEIGLREFIIDSYNKAFETTKWIDDDNGPLSLFSQNTYKEGKITLQEKVNNSRINLINDGWNPEQSKEIHSFYFLLFTDLKPLLEYKKYKNIKEEKIDVFGLKDRQIQAIISGMLSIFPIRNKIAHSVFLSDLEINALKSFKDTLEGIISNFNELFNKPIEREKNLILFKSIFKKIILSLLEKKDIYEEYSQFEKIYGKIQLDLDPNIKSAIEIIHQYQIYKNKKGSSILIKNLIEDNNLLFNQLIK